MLQYLLPTCGESFRFEQHLEIESGLCLLVVHGCLASKPEQQLSPFLLRSQQAQRNHWQQWTQIGPEVLLICRNTVIQMSHSQQVISCKSFSSVQPVFKEQRCIVDSAPQCPRTKVSSNLGANRRLGRDTTNTMQGASACTTLQSTTLLRQAASCRRRAHYKRRWRYPQNRKYTTYYNAATGTLHTLVKIRRVILRYACVQTHRQTDRQTCFLQYAAPLQEAE